jgi:Asp-tRNA(Asn)/Glu-tRNA(Gln) amidotransferase A subunit family amidase
MSKKWYNMFVSVDSPSGTAESDAEPAQADAAQMVAQIAAAVPTESKFSALVRNPSSFDEIYQAAEIEPPAHGYTIEKVASMLQSEHLRGLSAEVKRSSILVALEASGARIEDVIQDAVRRDRALDGYERVLQKSLSDVQVKKTEENRQIEAEMNKMLGEYRARIQANNATIAQETERFSAWRAQKQQEEKKIADTVGYFVSENPITVSGAAAAPSAGPKASGS